MSKNRSDYVSVQERSSADASIRRSLEDVAALACRLGIDRAREDGEAEEMGLRAESTKARNTSCD